MVRLAVIGTGWITEKFLEAAAGCEGACLTAVYSRDGKKAEKFARQHGAGAWYDDLDRLAADDTADAVYIASPNFLHYPQAMQMMKAGKHVLCEKPLASNSRQAQQMIHTSKEQGVVLLEAMRSVFDPGFEAVKNSLHKLGRIRSVRFCFGQYSSRYDAFLAGKHQNIFDLNCSTGALMDMGVYCVHPMAGLFGMPLRMQSACVKLRGGIDGAGSILAEYEGMTAELSYSKITNSRQHSEIQGEQGLLDIGDIASPREAVLCCNDGTEEKLEIEPCENNMIFEVRKWIQCIEGNGSTEEYHRMSLMSMQITDQIREQNKIVFPDDDPQKVRAACGEVF